MARNRSYFSPHDSNTICSTTGFKVKKSEVMERWDGTYVIGEAWHARHPQDFPVTPEPQKTIKNVLTEDLTTDAVPSFEVI